MLSPAIAMVLSPAGAVAPAPEIDRSELKSTMSADAFLALANGEKTVEDLKRESKTPLDKEELKAKMGKDSREAEAKLREIVMTKQNSGALQSGASLASYVPDNNDYVINEVLTSEENALVRKVVSTHEVKHHDNHNAGIHSLDMSLEQMYKVSMHDEISATMAEVLAFRDEYLKAEDKEAFLNMADKKAGKYKYYTEAIREGEINPEKSLTNKQAYDKEMSFIVNQTKREWEENKLQYYDKVFAKYTYEVVGYKSIDGNKMTFKRNDEAYKQALETMYNKNMGGVHFLDYMDKDVECKNQQVLKNSNFMENLTDKQRALNERLAGKKNFSYDGKIADGVSAKPGEKVMVEVLDLRNEHSVKPQFRPSIQQLAAARDR